MRRTPRLGMERITSRTNETVKAVVRLRERAERARRRLFFCEGVHLAEEFLRHGRPVERVFATDAALESHGALLAGFGDRVTLVTPEVYGKLSEEKAPQGILLVAPWPENVSGRKPSAKRRSILLDGVRDPGNVGTVIRTAAALGIGRVVLSRDCADVLACKTVRASMGAVLCTDILLADDLAAEVRAVAAAGGAVYAAMLSEGAADLSAGGLPADFSVVIGNEGQGVRPDVAAACTGCLRIPQTDRAESLNAAVAAAIFMWEMRKADEPVP